MVLPNSISGPLQRQNHLLSLRISSHAVRLLANHIYQPALSPFFSTLLVPWN